MYSDLVYLKIPKTVGTARRGYLVKISEDGSIVCNVHRLKHGCLLNSAIINWHAP
jgi:hypothetical protein